MDVQVPRGQPIFRKQDCSPFDIGVLFPVSRYSNAQKLELIENLWKPDPLHEFTESIQSGKSRKFRFVWTQKFPWLAYSKYLDGVFCLPCVMFGRDCGWNSNKLDKLVKSPLTCWTTAVDRFQSHSNGKCEMHNFSVIAMDNFMKVMRRQAVPVDEQLDNVLQQFIAKNRAIMSSLFKTIIFCGQNNIALRGRRDDDPSNC